MLLAGIQPAKPNSGSGFSVDTQGGGLAGSAKFTELATRIELCRSS